MADLELRIRSLEAATAERRLDELQKTAGKLEKSVDSLTAATKAFASAQTRAASASQTTNDKMIRQAAQMAAQLEKLRMERKRQVEALRAVKQQSDATAQAEARRLAILKKFDAAAKQQVKNQRDLQRELERNNKLIDKSTKRFAILGTAIGALAFRKAAEEFKKGVNSTVDLERALKIAALRSDDYGKSLAALTVQANDLGATTEFTATEVANAQKQLTSSGLNLNEVLSATPQVLDFARAATTEFEQAANIALNTVNQFGLGVAGIPRATATLTAASRLAKTEVTELGRALSAVGPIAASAGIGLEETSAALDILADQGLRGSKGGTDLRAVLASLIDPTAEAVREFEALARISGQAASDFDISQSGLDGVLKALKQAAPTAQSYFRIFERRSAPAAFALVQFNEKLQENVDQIKGSRDEVERFSKAIQGTLGNQIALATSAFDALRRAIVDRVRPALESVLRFVTSVANGLQDLVRGTNNAEASSRQLARGVLAAVGAFSALASVALINGLVLLTQTVISLVRAISAVRGALVSTGIGAVAVIIGTIVGVYLPEILEFFGILDDQVAKTDATVRQLNNTLKDSQQLQNLNVAGQLDPEQNAIKEQIDAERAKVEEEAKTRRAGAASGRKSARQQALEALTAKQQAKFEEIITEQLGRQAQQQRELFEVAKETKKALGVQGSILDEPEAVQRAFDGVISRFIELNDQVERATRLGQRFDRILDINEDLNDSLKASIELSRELDFAEAPTEAARLFREAREELIGGLREEQLREAEELQQLKDNLFATIVAFEQLEASGQASDQELQGLLDTIEQLSAEIDEQTFLVGENARELESYIELANQRLEDTVFTQLANDAQQLQFALNEIRDTAVDAAGVDGESLTRIQEARKLYEDSLKARERLVQAAREEGIEVDKNSVLWLAINDQIEQAFRTLQDIERLDLPRYFDEVESQVRDIALKDSLDAADVEEAQRKVEELRRELLRAPESSPVLEQSLKDAQALSKFIEERFNAQAGREALEDIGKAITDSLGRALTDVIFEAEKLEDVFDNLLKTLIRTQFQKLILDPLFASVNSLVGLAAGPAAPGVLSQGASAAQAAGLGASLAAAAAGPAGAPLPASAPLPQAAPNGFNPFVLRSRNSSSDSVGTAAGGSESITVIQNISTPDATSFQRSRGQIRNDAARAYKARV